MLGVTFMEDHESRRGTPKDTENAADADAMLAGGAGKGDTDTSEGAGAGRGYNGSLT